MTTTIRSDLGEQTIQSRPMRTFEVPDASGEQEFPPLPATIPGGPKLVSGVDTRYSNAAPLGDYNGLQEARRAKMGSGAFDDLKRQEEAMARARAAKFAPTRLSPAAKARIDILCGIARATRMVKIDGEEFGLQVLKEKEQRSALMAASQYDGTIEAPFEVRKQILARALFSIAGIDMAMFLGDDSLEARLEMFDELPELMLSKLFDEYNTLFSETRDKYFPKTEEAVKEVIEDLKK